MINLSANVLAKVRALGPFARLNELDEVSPEIAWKLVDSLYNQTTSLIVGATIFILLGLIGFVGTGSPWYVCGLVTSATICAWRLAQARIYASSRDTRTPLEWAKRSVVGGWLTAAGWGAWSIVVLCEPNRTLVMMIVGAKSACVIGAAVRNNAVRIVADGQVYLTLIPLLVVCLMSGNIYLTLYCGFVGLHILAALSLTAFLHTQTMLLLRQDEEKSGLLQRVEIARQEMEVINAHLETLVVTDALTGLANRRAFDLAAAREWRRSAREEVPMSLLMLDVDHFKAFNDRYGHPAGDACLQKVASAIADAVRRPGDQPARYGGEEFAVILPSTELEGAVDIGHNILAAIKHLGLPHEDSALGYVTVSIGAACMFPGQDTIIEQLTSHADAALYRAKRTGRNRVNTGAPWLSVPTVVADRAPPPGA